MNRRSLLCGLLATGAALLLHGPAAAAESRPQRPNIIVFYIDDTGHSDFGAYGSDVPTPHIDRLAKEGVLCTDGYSTCPVCSPSRASVLTGLYPQRFGVYGNLHRGCPIPADHPTLAASLAGAGYATGNVGRWDLGDREQGPLAVGFQFHAKMRPLRKLKKGGPTYLGEDGSYLTDLQATAMVDFVTRHRDRPFFLHFTPLAVHYPVGDVPERYLARVPKTIDRKRRHLAGSLIALDDAIGRVLTTLDELGLAEDTLIFFAGDNGGDVDKCGHEAAPSRGGKASAWDGGTRVPWIARWPARIPAGTTFSGLVSNLDIYPTALAAAGLAGVPQLDGVDLLPWFTGAAEGDPHEALFWDWLDRRGTKGEAVVRCRAVRRGRWRLLLAGREQDMQPIEGPFPKLFDLSVDRAERNDLAAAEPEVVAELTAAYETWKKTMREPLPIPDGRAAGVPQGQGWATVEGDRPFLEAPAGGEH